MNPNIKKLFIFFILALVIVLLFSFFVKNGRNDFFDVIIPSKCSFLLEEDGQIAGVIYKFAGIERVDITVESDYSGKTGVGHAVVWGGNEYIWADDKKIGMKQEMSRRPLHPMDDDRESSIKTDCSFSLINPLVFMLPASIQFKNINQAGQEDPELYDLYMIDALLLSKIF